MSEWDISPEDSHPAASEWGTGGQDNSDNNAQAPQGGESGSGWGQDTNDNQGQDSWGGNDSYGGESGGGYQARDNFGGNGRGSYGGRGRGNGGQSWDRGGGSRGGFGRDRGDRGDYSSPPHASGGYQGNGSGRQGFDGGFSSSRGGYGGGRGGFGSSSGFSQRPRGNYDMGVTPPDFSKLDLAPFKRDFYKEHSKVAERTESEVEQWRKQHSVTVDGKAPKPVLTWGESKLPRHVIEEYVVEKGYKAPTTIQCQAIPMALSGRDLIAISETGSGKTLAYAAPAMVHIASQPPTKPNEGPIALVLAPTRELATQILRECQALGKGGEVRSACAYGGVPRNDQLSDIRSGVDILIATPGRLLDFLSSGDVSLERVTYFVLDEADRMISLGFEKDVQQIISMIRPDRQTLMFSATFPPEVRSIAREFYRDAITVHLGLDVLTACSNIDQRVEIHRNFGQKIERLQQVLLEEVAPVEGKALIFVNKKATATEITEYLRTNSIEALSLHGDKRQEERDFALSEFRAGSCPVLVATDVAQRGLDVPDVTMVINFDCPQDASSYVHRIGRTGRAGKRGKAISFFGMRDGDAAEKIIEVLATNDVEVPDDLMELAKGYGYSSLPVSAPPEFEENQEGGGGDASGWNNNTQAVYDEGWGNPTEDPSSAAGGGENPAADSPSLDAWGNAFEKALGGGEGDLSGESGTVVEASAAEDVQELTKVLKE